MYNDTDFDKVTGKGEYLFSSDQQCPNQEGMSNFKEWILVHKG